MSRQGDRDAPLPRIGPRGRNRLAAQPPEATHGRAVAVGIEARGDHLAGGGSELLVAEECPYDERQVVQGMDRRKVGVVGPDRGSTFGIAGFPAPEGHGLRGTAFLG